MPDFDPGPPAAVAKHLDQVPGYGDASRHFWYDWGPIFYRGRLNGSARLLCVASDPGPTERIAGRTLVGDAGQRVQGFLSKLGLTRSYVLVNAFAYALLPSHAAQATPLLGTEPHLGWRNALLDLITGPPLQAVVAFGGQAQAAVDLWTDRPDVPRFDVPHPSSRSASVLADRWRVAIADLRAVVTADPDGDATGPTYGATLVERDYAAVPRRDLPYGLPPWFGDDAWGRRDKPRHNNCVERSSTDLKHTLVWRAPSPADL